jgi:signal transduction histidine kinase
MRHLARRTRVRLTAAYAGLFTVIALVAAAAFWFSFREAEYAGVDSALRSYVQIVLANVNDTNGVVSLNGGDPVPGETANGIAVGATLVGANGQVVARTGGSLPDATATRLASTAPASGDSLTTVPVGASDQRVLVERRTLDGTPGVLLLSHPLGETAGALQRVAVSLGVGVFVLVVLASALGYWLAGRALRPVRAIAATARDLSEHHLHRRITLDLPDDELGELALTFNELLDRLERSFSALQRFTADAAHELRTPIALIRAEAEVELSGGGDDTARRQALRSILAEAERLTTLADQLLLLTRADAGSLRARHDPVDITDLLMETADRWKNITAQAGMRLSVTSPPSGTLPGDVELLRRLLDNLVSNAVRHAAGAQTIQLTAQLRGDSTWLLVVQDDGAGIDEAIRGRLFERFTRGDPSRGEESSGAGLGLALSAAVARSHGGEIRLAHIAGSGARFEVELPGYPGP